MNNRRIGGYLKLKETPCYRRTDWKAKKEHTKEGEPMINITEIYDELKTDIDDRAAWKIAHSLGRIYHELLNSVKKNEFVDLTKTVDRLAQAQERTEMGLEKLAQAQERTEMRVEELAQAQNRTEIKVEELAEAQNRTEIKVEELAEAQNRTEIKVEELAEAQKRTEETMRTGFQSLDRQITTLGSRWGIQNENVFRNTIKGLLEGTGFSVERGFYGGREVDVVIRNGEHILLEITSRMGKKDIGLMNVSADDYETRLGINPKLMVAAIYIPPSVYEAFSTSPRPIKIFSEEEED